MQPYSPKRGSPSPQLKGPHRNVGAHHYSTTTMLWAHTVLGTESSAPFVKERGPKRKCSNKIREKLCVGGKRYVENVCIYAALSCLYFGIITQTAHCRAHHRCRRGTLGPRALLTLHSTPFTPK